MSTPTPKGPDSPVWTRRGDDPSTRSWGRDREPGAAFRGVPRGRGRGGGAPRGRPVGRGGGAGAGAGRSASARGGSDLKPNGSQQEKTAPGGDAVTNNGAHPRGRGTAKPSLRPPPLAVDHIMVSQSSDSTSPLSANKPPRRRRNTHKRAASAALAKPLVSTLTDNLPTSPSTTLIPPSKDLKDLPPHIAGASDSVPPVHDLRQDIVSLVEHVRSMAIDGHRPSSPSTHIDWAGDDDDSLPDLDDWGVSSKMVSEINGPVSKIEVKPIPAAIPSPKFTPAPAFEKTEPVTENNAQTPIADEAQSIAESPTDSSISLSAVPPVKRERERKRERGSRRDKEKRASLALQTNGSKGGPLAAVPRKSLLERISSPVRSEPPALPKDSVSAKPATQTKAPIQSTPAPSRSLHPSLPPKPMNVPTKPPLSPRGSGSWRDSQAKSSPPKESSEPVLPAKSETSTLENKEAPKNAMNGALTPQPPQPVEPAAPINIGTPNKSSFDWSEEPFDMSTGPSFGIEPPTPLEERASQSLHTPSPLASSGADAKSDVGSSPRIRSQRPLSGDATPRAPRDRSPYKTHNPRNHSAPQVGPTPGLGGRTRLPHTSRPLLSKSAALALIERSLHNSPPPRRESPPTTKHAE